MAKTKTKYSRATRKAKRDNARKRRQITKKKAKEQVKDSSQSSGDELIVNSHKDSQVQKVVDDQEEFKSNEPPKKDTQGQDFIKQNIEEKVIRELEKVKNMTKNTKQETKMAINTLTSTVSELVETVNSMKEQMKMMSDLIISLAKQQQPNTLKSLIPTQDTNEVLLGIALQNWKLKAHDVNINLELLRKQIFKMTEPQEIESMRRHCAEEKFWRFYMTLYYPQMAVRICMMHVQKRSERSIKNNINSYKVIGQICKDRGCEYLDYATAMQVEQWVKDSEKSNLKKLSTLNLYLSNFSQLLRQVYGVKEFSARIESCERPPSNLVVSIEDLKKIINWLRQQPNEQDQMFGFCMYLMLITAARNKTIRQIKFSAFCCDQLPQGNVYSFYIKETKTKKEKGFFIGKNVYDYVQSILKRRLSWAEEQREKLQYLDQVKRERLEKLIERRTQYLFSFFTQQAINHHLNYLKTRKLPYRISFMQQFLLHSIRKARIQEAYSESTHKALQVSGHSKLEVTQYYLKYVEVDKGFTWENPEPIHPMTENEMNVLLDSIDKEEVEDDESSEGEDEQDQIIKQQLPETLITIVEKEQDIDEEDEQEDSDVEVKVVNQRNT